MKKDDHPPRRGESIPITDIGVSVYTIPTDFPESDGTIDWGHTTMILVTVSAGGKQGMGYTYADPSVGAIIGKTLKPLLIGKDAMQIPDINQTLVRAIRNNGTCGLAMMGVSAVDIAAWDLKGKLLDLPVCSLLGRARDKMAIYGSGGFTSYSDNRTRDQFQAWAAQGISHFKMKIGREPQKDVGRVKAAREAIGRDASLYVDANGAYSARQATKFAHAFIGFDVTWFEEPVSSDDLPGLRFVREHSPAGCAIAAGEYGYHLPYFQAVLRAGAVDILQADATRCGGITNFLLAAGLAAAHQIPFSSHCAPAIHLQAALAAPGFFIAEYFHDHSRIESMFFDGLPQPKKGCLEPDLSRPGLGFDFKAADAEKHKL
ncbi:MAG: enolase C-terminal domain-like protein [Bacteroidota bacterium]|nr:enolase C-terminal domain-like protein [Bacteroidota bacterium]MDP4254036.1 enolase C-terminal domain-like protein [Bacteroidota bacterium]MDP4257434.1 enolase C-terminal domain-like protein [Bacteroidota bacterium]